MSAQKKILILIEWFTPGFKAGGPIQSCVNICIALCKNYDVYVLTTDTDHGEAAPYNSIKSNQWIYNKELGVQVYYANKNSLSFAQIRTAINQLQPEYLYLNLLFSPSFVIYPLWLKFTNKINSQVIICPRGTLYKSAVSLKSYKKKPLLLLYKWIGLRKIVSFHATNKREKDAINTYFPGSKIVIADNLPKMQQPLPVACEKKVNHIKLIFVARIVAIKNLLFLLQLLHDVSESVMLTIAGPAEDEAYWNECQQAIRSLPGNITVDYVGPQNNEAIAALLSRHHLFVLPTTGENFGHAIFEALLVGRPVLISNQTPWLNLEPVGAGWHLPLNSPKAFAAVIKEVAACNQQAFDIMANNAWQYANRFISNPNLIKPYFQMFS